MYDVTITNCNTLKVYSTKVAHIFDAVCGIDWVELHAQHEVEEQIDIKLTTVDNELVHIKGRKCND